jgi:hypothetical protein
MHTELIIAAHVFHVPQVPTPQKDNHNAPHVVWELIAMMSDVQSALIANLELTLQPLVQTLPTLVYHVRKEHIRQTPNHNFVCSVQKEPIHQRSEHQAPTHAFHVWQELIQVQQQHRID